MRVDTPEHESPSTGETADPPSTGGSAPAPALLSIAQREQVHNAAEAYIGALEKGGCAIDEATASHLYSAPWAIPSAHRPAGFQWPKLPPHLVDMTNSPTPPSPPGITP